MGVIDDVMALSTVCREALHFSIFKGIEFSYIPYTKAVVGLGSCVLEYKSKERSISSACSGFDATSDRL